MRILFATDGSECAEGAARFLARFDSHSDDELIMLHVIPRVPFRDDRESYYASLRHFREDIAGNILDASLDILRAGNARISTAVMEGDPESVILDVAEDAGADLIVIGARGVKGMKSLFLGSVTRSVATYARKPVLAVKSPLRESPGAMRVLFAADDSDHSRAAAGALAGIPFPENTELTIMNVVFSAVADLPERFALELDDSVKQDVARARAREHEESDRVIGTIREMLGKRFPGVRILSKIGDPALEILHAAESLGTDLIVVGSRGLTGLRRLLTSVSRNILGHAGCSVLIVKSDGESAAGGATGAPVV